MKQQGKFWSMLATLMLALLTVSFVSCKDDEADEVAVSQPSVNFSDNGGSQTIQVLSNTKWMVSGAPYWLTVAPSQGSGNGMMTLSATANTDKQARNCTLYVQAGDAYTMVTVNQSPGSSSNDQDIAGSYVGTLKPMGYSDQPAPCYITLTKLSPTTYRLTSLICESFGINVTTGINLVATAQSDGRIQLSTETTYVIEGNYFQGTLTLSIGIADDNFYFSGTKSF